MNVADSGEPRAFAMGGRAMLLVQILCCLAAGWLPAAAQARAGARLFVGTFVTKADAASLRNDLLAELRRLSSVTLVSEESRADLVLDGGGEIWIRGYRSLNPRSGRMPSDGSPVYSGYFSVEVRSRAGVTLWSYLATPGGDSSPDVSKDLSRKIVKKFAAALEHFDSPPHTAPLTQSVIRLSGAGATFPYPVYAKWFANYERESPGVQISYEPVGSEEGIRQLLSASVDFGASDNPQAVRDLKPGEVSKYLALPSVVGAVVPITNLPGIATDIAFTPEALAGIFLGKVRKWNDPVLQQANRGVPLPDLDIVVIHRADGSGTSYAWSEYLSKVSPQWKETVGSGMTPDWPVGRAGRGNDGVAKLVKELSGSIGYVEFIYALQNHLSYGKVRNRSGEFVSAGLESIAAALDGTVIREDVNLSLLDAPGRGAYPIASFSWLVVPTDIADAGKRAAITAFLRWMLGPGQLQAAALGYLRLPPELIAREQSAIDRIN